ncbi:MAG: AAA domain-containing protein [Acholeplasmataceae bacterium]|jgi:superfamily I DNA and/or RNA helicase/very-short-patch-repair endonuclease|nr:AAA domain-containing protein [Acholeplasmataceae bacterium]
MIEANNVYKSYKQRLISIDSRNSSFFLSRLLPKKHIDLVKVFEQLNNHENLLDQLIKDGTVRISRLKIDEETFIDLFKQHDEDYTEKAKELVPILRNEDFDQYENLLEKQSPEKKINEFLINLIQKYESESHKLFKQFDGLYNQGRAIERDFGKNDLYLGFPFVEGKFQNDKDFRGPLVLHRVSINENGSNIEIRVSSEGKLINPVFLLSYLNENGKDYKRFDFEIPDNQKDYLSYTIDFIKKNGVNLHNDTLTLQKIDSITKKEYANKYHNNTNVFDVKYYAVLGLFPISNRNIYNDLDYLDKNPNDASEVLNKFLTGSKEFDEEVDEHSPSEDKIKYISPIDWSQRIVIKNALKDNLVIEGPPGTGKSQTIVNIIINLLLKNKKILVVSEKLAAIEVVYNRLGKLRENTLIIKDYIRNKEDFFNQINESKHHIGEFRYDAVYDSTFDKAISDYIDALKQINNPDFYNGFSYEDVLKIAKNHPNDVFNDEQDKTINAFIKHVKDRDYNIKERILTLLDEKTIETYNQFEGNLRLDTFKRLNFKDINFFIDQVNSKKTKQQIQFNYYLHRLNRELTDFSQVSLFQVNLDKRLFNYAAFESYTQKLYDKINQFIIDLENLRLPLYKELGIDKSRIRLAIQWSDLAPTDKDKSIRKIYSPNYKLSFWAKVFKKRLTLTEEELEFQGYLDNFADNFDITKLSNIIDNFLETDLLIAIEFSRRGYKTLPDLMSLILASNFIEFNDVSFDKIFSQFKLDFDKINQTSFNYFLDFDVQELNILELFKKSKMTKEDFIDYVLYAYIDQKFVNAAVSISTYFEKEEENYINVKQSFESKYQESAQYVYAHVKNNIASIFRRDNTIYTEYNGLLSQAELKRRKSVKTIFDRYANAITTMFPVILMTPDVVSTVFKLKRELFDYVIFDEASQMFIERAVPAIHRAKNVIVAGDSKQLKPSSTFTSRLAESGELDDDDSVSNIELEALDKESLLQMAKDKYKSKMIQFHYRSEHEELIEFSSAAFYERKLFFATKIDGGRWKKPIEVIDVQDGFWTSDNTNPNEAEKVVNLVSKLLEKRKLNETIGIITFNIKQKEYIQDLLEDSEDKNIRNEMERINLKTGDDESLFVKNIENVQGDERDIIIFSIGYARNKDDRIRAQFGLLNQSGGENRLNVAITRAKKKIFVVKSIKAKELQVNEKNAGPLRLKQYLEFCEYVDQSMIEEKKTLLNLIHEFGDIYINGLNEFDSPFEQEVYDELIKVLPNKLIIKNQVNVGGFLIDFAIYDKENEKFILGIECDGYRWHSRPEDRERDFYRQQYLESRGWNIHRIISTNWWNNKYKEIDKTKLIINAILERKSNP